VDFQKLEVPQDDVSQDDGANKSVGGRLIAG
jgi:hypothetical protein